MSRWKCYFANAAAGTAAVKGDNFRAWGHGPLTGDVSLDEDEPMVTYTIPCVHQGEFAEARIAFPSDWVPQLAASGEERMSTILSEEKEWADEANARRAHARMIANATCRAKCCCGGGLYRHNRYAQAAPAASPSRFFRTNISAMCLRPTIPLCFRPS